MNTAQFAAAAHQQHMHLPQPAPAAPLLTPHHQEGQGHVVRQTLVMSQSNNNNQVPAMLFTNNSNSQQQWTTTAATHNVPVQNLFQSGYPDPFQQGAQLMAQKHLQKQQQQHQQQRQRQVVGPVSALTENSHGDPAAMYKVENVRTWVLF